MTVLDGAIQPITNDKGATTLARGKPFKLATGKARIQLVRSLGVCRKAMEDYEKARVGLIKEYTDGGDDIDAWVKENPDETIGEGDAAKTRTQLGKEFYKKVEEMLKDEIDLPLETKVKLSEVLNIKADKKDSEEGNGIPGTALDRLLPLLVDDISDTPPAKKEEPKSDTH